MSHKPRIEVTTRDEFKIHLTKERIVYLSLPTPISPEEKEKLKLFIDMTVAMICVEKLDEDK